MNNTKRPPHPHQTFLQSPAVSFPRIAALALCACLALGVLPASAGEGGVEIESLRYFGGGDAQGQNFEIIYSNDGTRVDVFLGAHARSKDGMTRSPGFAPVALMPGQHVRAVARVLRPNGAQAQATDLVVIEVYQGGVPVFLRKRFTRALAWPALPEGSAASPDESSYGAAASLLRSNFEEEDFAALDMLVEQWNSPAQRLRNGMWKLSALPLALNVEPQGNAWAEALERIRRWQQSNPKSTGAAIAEARYWMRYAWHIRGGCRCSRGRNVDPVALRVFGERMKRAEQVLLDARSYAGCSPLWYETYLDIASDTRRGEDFIQKLFEEGVGKFPGYLPLYTGMAGYWVPWDGSVSRWDKVDAVVSRAVQAMRDTDGEDNYARIYAELSAAQRLEVDVMSDSMLSWPRMRAAYQGMAKRYPSMDNLNEFAAFACRARDKETFLTLSARIQGHVVPNAWPENYSIDLCNHRFMQST